MKRRFWLILAFLLALPAYLALQAEAKTYLADVRHRAFDVFLIAQASNGIIAVIESTQVGPVVVEGRPGMLLEPVREVVDRLGEMMTVSVITLEALEILQEAGGWLALLIFFPLALLVWLAGRRSGLHPVGKGLLVAGLMLTLGLSATICAEEAIAKTLLKQRYDAAYQNVSQIETHLSDHDSWFSSAGAKSLSQWLNDKIESALRLMTLFLLEVFLLPSLLGYGLYRALRALVVRVMTAPISYKAPT